MGCAHQLLFCLEPPRHFNGEMEARVPLWRGVISHTDGECAFNALLHTFSYRVTLYNMLTGRLPFDGAGLYQLFTSIRTKDFRTEGIPQPCLSLIYGMLTKDPTARMGVDAIIRHAWVGRMAPVEFDPEPLIWCLRYTLHAQSARP